MSIDLSKYGIQDVKEIIHNPSYEELYKAETCSCLTGFEKGVDTELGAVNVMTGVFTGRSPKDKYIVRNPESEGNVWWAQEGRKGSDRRGCRTGRGRRGSQTDVRRLPA